VQPKLPNWTGDTVLILASGPSLRDFIREGSIPAGVRTIAVNSSIFAAPVADVCLALDFMWWKMHHQQVRKQSKAACWTTDRSAGERFGVNVVRAVHESGLHPTRVATHGNSGAAAISFAVLTGAKRVLLLGMDMAPDEKGEGHWHGSHPKPCAQGQPFADWTYKMDALARACEKAGVEVVNCSTRTVLTCFPRMTLEEATRANR
jgi:hypothetical protein